MWTLYLKLIKNWLLEGLFCLFGLVVSSGLAGYVLTNDKDTVWGLTASLCRDLCPRKKKRAMPRLGRKKLPLENISGAGGPPAVLRC